MAAVVLLVGVLARAGFDAMFPPPEPSAAPVVKGPYTLKSSSRWVHRRERDGDSRTHWVQTKRDRQVWSMNHMPANRYSTNPRH